MNNLKKLIRALVHIHMKIDDYIESNYLLPTSRYITTNNLDVFLVDYFSQQMNFHYVADSESALAECYAVIKFLLLDDLNILRQFFKHLPFGMYIIK